MGKVYVSILMVILFSTVVVSLSYAQASCCSCRFGMLRYVPISRQARSNIRATSPAPTQMKVRTANQSPPQLNPMPWCASINQIGNLQRLPPAASRASRHDLLPWNNSAGGCCVSPPQSALIQDQSDLTGQKSTPRASAMSEILAFSSIFGTLW